MNTSQLLALSNIGLGRVGLGAIEDQIAAALKLSADPTAVVQQFWAQIQGRTWTQAIAASTDRAEARNWPSGSTAAKDDFVTILIGSALVAKAASDRGDLETANNLNRTWVILAKRMNIANPTASDVTKMKSTAASEVAPIIIIAAALIGALAVAGIIVALLYFASRVIDDVLSKIECDRELVRLHNEYARIVDKHQKDGTPYSSDEKDLLEKLLAQQEYVSKGCTRPPADFNPWPYVLGVGVVTTLVLGLAYHKEIADYVKRA